MQTLSRLRGVNDIGMKYSEKQIAVGDLILDIWKEKVFISMGNVMVDFHIRFIIECFTQNILRIWQILPEFLSL